MICIDVLGCPWYEELAAMRKRHELLQRFYIYYPDETETRRRRAAVMAEREREFERHIPPHPHTIKERDDANDSGAAAGV